VQLTNLNNLKGIRDKLIDYSLNPTHPIGKNKALVFQSALGYTQQNADDLVAKIRSEMLSHSNTLIEFADNGYGKQFSKILNITGPNGQTKPVNTAWIYDNGKNINFPVSNSPRLVTAYVN